MGINRDFRDLFSELCAAESRQDLDIWIEPSPENARRVFEALARFGRGLGSTRAWFEEDAEDARRWLLDRGLMPARGRIALRV